MPCLNPFPTVKWAPPAGYEEWATFNLTNAVAAGGVDLPAEPVRVICQETITEAITFNAEYSFVAIGGEVRIEGPQHIPAPYGWGGALDDSDRRGIVGNDTGTPTGNPVAWIEGWWFWGRDLSEGINPGNMPDFDWYIVNCRVERLRSRSSDEANGAGAYEGNGSHPDGIQLWAGVNGLFVDGFTIAETNYQGYFDGETSGAVVRNTRWIRRMNITGVDLTTPTNEGGPDPPVERSSIRLFRGHKLSNCGPMRIDDDPDAAVWVLRSPNSSQAEYYCGDDGMCSSATTRFGYSGSDALGDYRTFDDIYLSEPEVVFTVPDHTNDQINKTGHGLAVDDSIWVETVGTGGAPLANNTQYWVVEIVDSDNFKISTTQGGSVLDITQNTSGTWEYQKIRLSDGWARNWDDTGWAKLYVGEPPGGDYVPRRWVGLNYTSPGYP